MARAQAQAACVVCGGTGWRPGARGDEPAVVRCECQLALREGEALSAARIPLRYKDCTLGEFNPAGAPELENAHFLAKRFGEEYSRFAGLPRSGLLFYGDVGVGKTHLAVGILHQLLDRGIGCRFADHQELLKEIQSTFDPTNPATEAGVVRPLLEVEVLLLDDLGVGRATEWARETLHYILNRRYSEKLATLITTNLEDAEPRQHRMADGKTYEPTGLLVQAVGKPLHSRLYEMCVFVAMHGSDYRRAGVPPVVR